jgi:allantoin racemase
MGGDTPEQEVSAMPFRLKIVSPLHATEADLQRRQRRYEEHARPGTAVRVVNLHGGPPALDTAGDVLVSAAAVFREAAATTPTEADAILVDCVFDPAVEELREATGVPTFGPTRVSLPSLLLVAARFAIVARSVRHCELLAATVARYGHGSQVAATRALGLSYEEARCPETFEAAMCAALRCVREEDGAGAVLLGSTTMAVTDRMREAAGGLPLFMPGLVALRVLEMLWQDGLWPGRA